MPPINQQGSKTGLISAIVSFVILFVVSVVFAIYYGVQLNNEQTLHKQDVLKYAKVANPSNVGNGTLLGEAKGTESLVDVLVKQRDDFSKLVTGTGGVSLDSAQGQARDALAAAKQVATKYNVPVSLPNDSNLIDAVRKLSAQVVALSDEVARSKADVVAANKKADQAVAEREAVAKDAAEKIAAAVGDADKAHTELANYQQSKSNDVASMTSASQTQVKAYQDSAGQLQQQVTQREAQIKDLQTTVTKLQSKLKGMRIDPSKQMIQQADGEITRTLGSTVFISIGQQQNVTPGLTFEVYDRNGGIPALSEGQAPDDQPAGKASIEVTHVLSQSAECRVVRTAPGKQIVQGDLIMNLVFDPHVKYNFVVYGDFDLAQTGNASPGDAEVIKRLITQWGGKLQDPKTLNTDTDFLVLGKEPVVPTLTADDQSNAQLVMRHDAAQAALDSYLDLRQKAVQFGIPIMNQNRFLYYTGHYELAQR